MHQIHISSIKNDKIYRIVQVAPSMSIFDFDTVLSAAFMIDEEDDVVYQSTRLNGKNNNEQIYLYSENFHEYESLEETVGDWFLKIDDEMHYISEAGIQLRLTLQHVIEMDDLEACIIEGQGDLFSKRKKVDIEELNRALQLEKELEQSLFAEGVGNLAQYLVPDYLTLFEVADELKKLKPWNYFKNEDIIAVQLDDMKYFISVMGAGGQEFGLMMYDEDFGYSSLEKIIDGSPLSDDFSYGISALTVNYVDRDELEKEDYELIKEQGLSFRGKKNWIALRTYEPGFVPMQPDYSEVEDMIDLIKIMIAVTKMRMNGWEYPNVPVNGFPIFEAQDNGEISMLGIIRMERIENAMLEIEVNDLEIAKLKKKPKSALEIELDNFYLQYTVVGPDERPLYPLVNVIIDHMTGEIIHHDIIPFPKHSFVQQQLFWQTLNNLSVRPSKVFVAEEAYHFLKPIAKLVGIELVAGYLPHVEEFKEVIKFNPPF